MTDITIATAQGIARPTAWEQVHLGGWCVGLPHQVMLLGKGHSLGASSIDKYQLPPQHLRSARHQAGAAVGLAGAPRQVASCTVWPGLWASWKLPFLSFCRSLSPACTRILWVDSSLKTVPYTPVPTDRREGLWSFSRDVPPLSRSEVLPLCPRSSSATWTPW